MTGRNLPIGVFDSGLGGLSVLKNIRSLLPQEDIIYFGDTKRAPYGFYDAGTLRSFTRDILNFMKEQKIKLAVAACNTITVNLGNLPEEFNFGIVGMQNGLPTAAGLTQNSQIGVIGTVATIKSNKHLTQAKELYPHLKIFPVACPELASLVEAGQLRGAAMEKYMREYLTPLKEAGVDTVIMACTHYPLLVPVIREVLADVHLVDPGEETALYLKQQLEKNNLLKNEGDGYDKFYFSANLEQAKFMVEHIGRDKGRVECVSL